MLKARATYFSVILLSLFCVTGFFSLALKTQGSGETCNMATVCPSPGDVCYGSGLWQCWPQNPYPVLYTSPNPYAFSANVNQSPAPDSFIVYNLKLGTTAFWSASTDQAWCKIDGVNSIP